MNRTGSRSRTLVSGLVLAGLIGGGLLVGVARADTLVFSGLTASAWDKVKDRASLEIDRYGAFSSVQGKIYLSGQIDCPVGFDFALRARVRQADTGGPVTTSFAQLLASAGGGFASTSPRHPDSFALGSSNLSPCSGDGTPWNLTAAFTPGSAFAAGPAEACVKAGLSKGSRMSVAALLCQTVELIGG